MPPRRSRSRYCCYYYYHLTTLLPYYLTALLPHYLTALLRLPQVSHAGRFATHPQAFMQMLTATLNLHQVRAG